MDVRTSDLSTACLCKWMLVVLAIAAFGAGAQTRTAVGQGTPRLPPAKPTAYNPLSKSSTPFDCKQYRGQVYPIDMQRHCQGLENAYVQGEARRVGRPTPSVGIVDLPALGSAEAKSMGYACVGGTAKRRLANGWEQVKAGDGWQRCRER